MKKNRLLTSVLAVALAGVLLFGGTFAWQSISQTALNEVAASVNPGGRLHDDFNDITKSSNAATMTFDKNVYVENFTELANNGVQVFARVRLDEYMEFGTGAGTEGASNEAVSLVEGARLADKSTWTPHKLGDEEDENNPFHRYWDWTLSGDAVTYMPTFNKNKDSLEADINGSFKMSFADYVDYSTTTEKTANAIYDVDTATDGQEMDEIVQTGLTANEFINAADNEALTTLKNQIANVNDHIKIEGETHTAKSTLDGTVMSMERYMARLASTAAGNDDFTGTGNFWVYDTDGWAYWANPIDPETATAPLLNGISRTEEIINQDWYYAINVVAQFITYDDMGQDDNTGFYDIEQGTYPSADALTLLKTIGVDVPEADVSTEEALAAVLAQGGIVNVTENIELNAPLTASASCVLNLGENQITADYTAEWDTNTNCALIYVSNGATVVINSDETGGAEATTANDCYGVMVSDGSKVVINGGKFVGNAHAVYVQEGEAVINGGKFSLCAVSNEGYNYVLNCTDVNYANGTAKITVYGGEFVNFDPSNCASEGEGTNFVAAGYESNGAAVGENTVYTVTKTSTPAGSEGE